MSTVIHFKIYSPTTIRVLGHGLLRDIANPDIANPGLYKDRQYRLLTGRQEQACKISPC